MFETLQSLLMIGRASDADSNLWLMIAAACLAANSLLRRMNQD